MSENETRADGAGMHEETGRPSVRLTRNAKGDVQIDVKVYAAATDETAVQEAAQLAQSTFDDLARTYPMRSANR